MRTLDAEQVKDVARGAAILGTGGGGDPYLGTLAALRVLEEYGPPTVLTADELDDDALIAMPVMVGAPVPLIEKLSFGTEPDTVYHALDNYLEGKLVALMSPEMGGVNSIVPLLLGARLGIPVVDADSMGRAYPEIDLTTLTLYGIDASPFALADEHGNSVVIRGVSNRWVERIARAAVVEFGAICAGMGFPMTGAQLREAAILGTLTYAEQIGAAIREAKGSHGDAIADVVRLTNGYVLFEGKITDVRRRTMHGWSVGEAVMEGTDAFTDGAMTVSFQNENLVAWVDGQVVLTVPDLICIVNREDGEPLTTELLRYGSRVAVVGIPCSPMMRTQEALAVVGPKAFGYDLEFASLESLA